MHSAAPRACSTTSLQYNTSNQVRSGCSATWKDPADLNWTTTCVSWESDPELGQYYGSLYMAWECWVGIYGALCTTR